MDSLEGGVGRQDVPQRKQLMDRTEIDLTRNGFVLQKRFYFGTKTQPLLIGVVVQRFHPEPISNENELLLSEIPNRNCKHALEVSYEIESVLFVGVNDRFCIALSVEAMSESGEPFAKIWEVVDLTIEDDRDRVVFVEDWLGSALDINDGESPHRQPRAWHC